MIVIFLRHGEAEEAGHGIPGMDEHRQLTSLGRKETEHVAATLNRLKLRPRIVFTSPLVRAIQTAAVASAVLKGAPEPAMIDNLAPGHAWKDVRRDIERTVKRSKDNDPVVLVCGHQPDMGQYLADALLQQHHTGGMEIGKSAAVCVLWQGTALGAKGRILLAVEPNYAKRILKLTKK